jgi:ABC-type phosphate transport system permease subunit
VKSTRGRKAVGSGLTLLTGAATACILVMLAAILSNVVLGGREKLSWEFLTQAPTEGMTSAPRCSRSS